MKAKGQFAHGRKVFPCSTRDLFEQSKELRKLLCLNNTPKFPVIKFLEAMPRLYDDFDFEIVDKSELTKGYFAQYNPILGLVSIGETFIEWLMMLTIKDMALQDGLFCMNVFTTSFIETNWQH